MEGKKVNEITLVTAFFDIGRKDYKRYPRSNDDYLEYFSVWARMNNKVIVYTNSDMAKKVIEVRRKYGLESKTIIVEVNDETKIEKELYDKMHLISQNDEFLNFRFIHDALSNNAKYDYVMLLKYWCLKDAVQKGYANGMVAWIDFGFNHGDKCYINPEEFNFTWKTNLNSQKIHLFSLHELDDTPIFKHVMKLDDSLMGAPIILPDFLCDKFWNLVKLSMESLIRVGFIDDDQLLILMAYRENKELFEIHISDWFLPLKENGGEHLTVRKKEKVNRKISLKHKIKQYVLKKKVKKDYLNRISTILNL